MIGKGKGFAITLRPIVSMVTIPWTAGMAVFAASVYGDYSGDMWTDAQFYWTLILVMMASFLGVTAGYALNDYFDYQVDLANPVRMDKAANHGLARKDLLVFATILGIPSLLIWLYLSPLAFVVVIVQLACILAYSAWAKPNMPYSNLFVVLPTALMPITVFFVYTDTLAIEAVLLALVNLAFEPGFTWAGVCRDVESDAKLNIPSLPIVKGIPAVAKMVLTVWIAVAAFTVMAWYYTDLGMVFLIGGMFAAIWLIASAVAFVKTPTAEMGGATFMKSILWFWVFSISLIVDAAINIQI